MKAGLPPTDEQPYTARLASAGSRRSEFEAVITAANPLTPPEELRRLVIDDNIAGKRSLSAREKTWRQLRERYILDPNVPEYRAFVNAWQRAQSRQDRGLLCFLMMARADRTFRDLTLESVSPLLQSPGTTINNPDVQAILKRHLALHSIDWTATTFERVWQHTLAALKDFGVLEGSRPKSTARINPGPTIALFAARLGRLEGLTDLQILESDWFRLLGCSRQDAINLMFAASRDGLITFRMQAEVVELELPEIEAA